MQFQEIGKQALNKTVKVAHIEYGLHNSKSGVEWTVGSDLMDAKECMEGTGGHPFTQEVSFNISHSMQLTPTEPAYQNKNVVETSADVVETFAIIPSQMVS